MVRRVLLAVSVVGFLANANRVNVHHDAGMMSGEGSNIMSGVYVAEEADTLQSGASTNDLFSGGSSDEEGEIDMAQILSTNGTVMDNVISDQVDDAALEFASSLADTTGNNDYVITWALNGHNWRGLSQSLGNSLSTQNSRHHEIKGAFLANNGGWIVIYQRNGFTWNGIPQSAVDRLNRLNSEGRDLKKIAFTANGGWMILHGRNGYWAQNVPTELFNWIRAKSNAGEELYDVTFRANGGWAAITSGHWIVRNGPSNIVNKMRQYAGELRKVSFTPNGGFMLIRGINGWWAESPYPSAALDVIRERNRRHQEVKCVSFPFH